MTMPTYAEWKDETSRTFKSRGTLLDTLDQALRAYNQTPSQTNLIKLDTALTAWKDSKTDWNASCRNHKGMVTRLVTEVASAKSTQLGRGAYIAPSVTLQAVQKVRARQAVIDADSTEVRVAMSQVLDYRDGSGDQNFGWNVNFKLTKRRTAIEATVRVKPKIGSVVVAGPFQQTWKTHIQSAWNNQARFRDGDKHYDVTFNLEFVNDSFSGNAYEVNVRNPPPQPRGATWQQRDAQRRAPIVGTDVGTPDMGIWGGEDRRAIAHEFGHMIGNPDEYYTKKVDGVVVPADIYDQVPFTTDSLMNNTGQEGRIHSRHFYFVRDQYATWQGVAADTIEVIISRS